MEVFSELSAGCIRLQTSLVQFIPYGTAETKLAILAFLYCAEFAETPISFVKSTLK